MRFWKWLKQPGVPRYAFLVVWLLWIEELCQDKTHHWSLPAIAVALTVSIAVVVLAVWRHQRSKTS